MSRMEIETFLSSIKLKNFEILHGVFPKDIGHLILEILSLTHIDVGVYGSAKQIWNFVNH
jgi:hypothetical protein